MSDGEYAVVCNGEIAEGFDLAEVKAELVALFKQPIEKIENIFSRPRVVIKSGLDEARAEHFKAALSRVGLIVHVESVTPSAASAATAALGGGAWGLAPAGDGDFGGSSGPGMASGIGEGVPPRTTAAVPSAVDEDEEPRQVAFVFHGDGKEYFNIWIVNVLLSIVTLGVYSAWAKVRNKQYFYGNTELDGARFEYTGQPKAILKGRLLAGAVFVAYSVAGNLFPTLGLLFFLLLLTVMPWMITRSLMFNARNSIYRNVRLRFDGALKHAYIAFAALPVAAMLSFGLLAPLTFYYQQRFFVENHHYGTTRFQFEAGVKDYYKMFLVLVLVFAGGVGGGALFSDVLPLGGLPLMLAAYLFVFIYFSVLAFNLRFNNTFLGHSAFAADMRVGAYSKLVVVNTLATAVTLGLFRPWAMVRTVRYKSEHLRLLAEEDLDGFIAHEEAEVSAIGEEMGDMFDFDFGL